MGLLGLVADRSEEDAWGNDVVRNQGLPTDKNCVNLVWQTPGPDGIGCNGSRDLAAPCLLSAVIHEADEISEER